jgi:hypothetical protein
MLLVYQQPRACNCKIFSDTRQEILTVMQSSREKMARKRED